MRRNTSDQQIALRTAVVGCGAIAHEHLAALRALSGVRIVGVCDVSPALARTVGEMYGSAASFDDLETMLVESEPDVLHVLTPPHTHAPLVTMGLTHGCHVVCEKPLTVDRSALGPLLDQARERGLLLIESQNLRFNDEVLALDEMVRSGALGSIREVDVSMCLDLTAGPMGDLNLCTPGSRQLPGGAVQDFLPHLVYLFLHFATGDTAAIDTALGVLANRSGNRRVGYDSLDVMVESSGVRGRLHVASDIAPDAFRLRIRGTERSVETDFYNPYLRVEGGSDVGKRAPLEQVKSGVGLVGAGVRNLRNKVVRHDTMHGLPRMLDQFYQAVATRSAAPISPEMITANALSVERILDGVTRLEHSEGCDGGRHRRSAS